LIARRVVAAFDVPFDIDGQEVLLQPSFGLAVAAPEDHDTTGAALLKKADAAMYSAKRLRTGGLQTFSVDMEWDDPEESYRGNGFSPKTPHDGAIAVRLLGELRRAIAHSDLVTVYQPKFDLRTHEIVGVEALVRWPHPDRGILGPEEFLPLVREHGLMRDVTEHVLEMTLDDALDWNRNGERVPVAVNLFAASLSDTGLPDQILDALAARHLRPEALIVEITEDLLVDDMTRAREILHTLRDAGVRVALDDFGSGYSALRNLLELPIDELKLDRGFISSLITDQRSASIVRAVIDLAHDLGVATVAEGVENAETAQRLSEYGCEMAQGFYYCRPVGPAEVLELLITTPTRL
jgi:EAL domain-containing protein (putative c-di-GMP-specific phosphodiesterase class I)